MNRTVQKQWFMAFLTWIPVEVPQYNCSKDSIDICFWTHKKIWLFSQCVKILKTFFLIVQFSIIKDANTFCIFLNANLEIVQTYRTLLQTLKNRICTLKLTKTGQILGTQAQYGQRKSEKKVNTSQFLLPQHQSTYPRGPESASIEIPHFRPKFT